MAHWGRCDFKELKLLTQRIEQLEKANWEKACRQAANEIAQILLNKVIKRSYPGQVPEYATEEAKQLYWSGYEGGKLRQNWTILPIEKRGNEYVITLINNLEYASYVEYGHRQTPGRYVPALGMRLKSSWVPGKFMMTISMQETERLIPKKVEQAIYQALKEVF